MESAWLIELPLTTFKGPPCWWTGNYSTGCLAHQWATDTLLAVRFSRKQDAEMVIKNVLRLKEAIATEHQWG